ncbi:TPA: hypothetical protein DIS60_00455 [Patescibacteria group bacterium]|nr:hypothetical protein [Patescibacteria group bacterium]
MRYLYKIYGEHSIVRILSTGTAMISTGLPSTVKTKGDSFSRLEKNWVRSLWKRIASFWNHP